MQEGAPQPSVITPGQQPAPVPSPSPQQFQAQIPEAAFGAPQDKEVVEDIVPVSWSASEFIAHAKSAGWYLVVAITAIVVDTGIYFLTRDPITTVMVLIIAVLFAVMGARKPRELTYIVDGKGITIGEKFYSYASFKSFSILQEEGMETVWFMPLKRFMPGLSIYFAPEDGQKIVDVIAEFLPFEDKQLDFIDQLMHRLRF